MTQPGISVILHELSGGNRNDPKKYAGKKIKKAFMKDGDDLEEFHLKFEDGTEIALQDDGQS